MDTRNYLFFANMADEDKIGKFMAFSGISEEAYEDLCMNVPVVGTNDYFIVPLDCLDLVCNPWMIDYMENAVAMLDLPFMVQNTDLIVCNAKDLDREW